VNNLEKKIGEVTHYFGHIPAGIIKLGGKLKAGDKVRFKGATTDFTQEISSMQVDHKDIDKAKKGDEVGIKVDERVREGDEVFLVK
jgi:putative protease